MNESVWKASVERKWKEVEEEQIGRHFNTGSADLDILLTAKSEPLCGDVEAEALQKSSDVVRFIDD